MFVQYDYIDQDYNKNVNLIMNKTAITLASSSTRGPA